MNHILTTRAGAICGVLFALTLVGVNGDGSGGPTPARAALSIGALTFALIFVAVLADRAHRFSAALGAIALACGTAGILLKILSGVGEMTALTTRFGRSSDAHHLVDAMSNSATVIALAPLAVFSASVAVAGFGGHVLPRWLSGFAAVTAAALAVNAAFVTTTFVPALLLFTLWVLVTGVYLIVRPERAQAGVLDRAAVLLAE